MITVEHVQDTVTLADYWIVKHDGVLIGSAFEDEAEAREYARLVRPRPANWAPSLSVVGASTSYEDYLRRMRELEDEQNG